MSVLQALFIVPLIALAVAGAALVQTSGSTLDHGEFSFSLVSDSDDVVLRCHEGCTWTDLRFTCPATSCSALLTKDGVDLTSDAEFDDSEHGFRLVMTRTGTQFDLTCQAGCAWTTLSFSRHRGGAEIDQMGVHFADLD